MNFRKLAKTLKEPKLVLVRHGHTSLNGTDDSVDRIRGWKNVPLNDQGIKDAVRAGKELARYDVDLLYSSDLVRAKQTATIVHQDWPKAPMIFSMNFRPWNLGVYEGQETDKVIDDLNRMVRDEDSTPTDGESFRKFKTRYLSAVKVLADTAVKKNKEIVLVTHFRNLKTLDAWVALGAPDNLEIDKDVMITDTFKPGELYEVNLDKVVKS